jgi:prepilin-type N-terminal cleavage/methylation domain-containing protein
MRGAFTMIELVFVIVIIGILSLFAIPQFSEVQEGAKRGSVDQFLTQLRLKMVARYEYNGYSDLNNSTLTLPVIIASHLGDNYLKNRYTSLATYISFSSTPLHNTQESPVIVCVGEGALATTSGCQSGSNDYNLTLANETKKSLQGRDINVRTLLLTRKQ